MSRSLRLLWTITAATAGLAASASAPVVETAPRTSPSMYAPRSAQNQQVACNDDDSSDDSGSGDSSAVDSEA